MIRVTGFGDHWAHALCVEHGKHRELTVAAAFRLRRGLRFYNRDLRGNREDSSPTVVNRYLPPILAPTSSPMRTGMSFFTAIVKSEGGSILKSESVEGMIPEIRVSLPCLVT